MVLNGCRIRDTLRAVSVMLGVGLFSVPLGAPPAVLVGTSSSERELDPRAYVRTLKN